MKKHQQVSLKGSIIKGWILFFGCLLCEIQEGMAQTSTTSDTTVIAFVNVDVASMRDEHLLKAQTVIIHGDLIESIGPVDAQPIPKGARVIDGSGSYLIPGLADMHVHVQAPFDDGPLFLNAGITTVLSLGTRARASTVALAWQKVLDERLRSRTSVFIGPALYSVGPQIEGYASDTPDEVEHIVRENVKSGFDFVKIHKDISPEAFDRLHDIANQLGIRVTGHGQRHRGMKPVYARHQDLAHVEEYLYAAFNPRTPGLWISFFGGSLVLLILSITNVSWWMGALWRRLRMQKPSSMSPDFTPMRRWFRIFTLMAWLLFIGLWSTVTDPFAGIFAGNIVAISLVCGLMLLVVLVAIVLTMRVWGAWREGAAKIWSHLVIIALTWIFVACTGFLTPRSWRATEAALERIAKESAAAGIWVTPNLVSLDYLKRQNTDEFYELIQRPEMRFLRPATRDMWINDNEFRRLPDAMRPMQFAIWKSWTRLMSQLTRKLHEAHVPLLAGSDATGPDGVLPGSGLHEELSLLVQAGLTPYEALRTATVNPAVYLDAEHEFGKVVAGFCADLVLLKGNPLEDINNVRTRVGVMKRGRWFPADELETTLAQLAIERK
jgi:imidazolonepropionase-like amidohydrolase